MELRPVDKLFLEPVASGAKHGLRKSRRDRAATNSGAQRPSSMKNFCPFKPNVSKNDVKAGENQARDMSCGVEKKFFSNVLCK